MTAWDDTDYAATAHHYATIRREDPFVRAQIVAALGDAVSVLNIGAGTGSYEPTDRTTVAVEPSADMRARRPRHLTPAIDATAQSLPFDDDTVDAGLAILTIHHWPDLTAGLRELARVVRDRIVIVTADPDSLHNLWLAQYCPEFHAVERRRYPMTTQIADALGWDVSATPLVINAGCSDGFADAHFGRPEALLDPAVRGAQSAWSFVSGPDQERFVQRLGHDLNSGEWDRHFGHLRTQPTFEGSLQIVVATPAP